MKYLNKNLLFSFFIPPFISFSEEFFEEVTKKNSIGQPMFIDYLEMENQKKQNC